MLKGMLRLQLPFRDSASRVRKVKAFRARDIHVGACLVVAVVRSQVCFAAINGAGKSISEQQVKTVPPSEENGELHYTVFSS